MAAVTYQLLHETVPLQPTYIQLQMVFQVIDMGEDEYDPPIILGRPFLNTIKIRMRRTRHNRNQRRKIIKDGWADYEG